MKFKFWLGTIISIGLLVFLFSKVDFRTLWAVMRAADPLYVTAAIVTNIFFFGVRAVRWRYLLAPVKKNVPVGALFSATMIGFMANNVLPARLGEVVRAHALGRRGNLSTSSVFASIVVERLFDSMSVLLLLVYVLAFLPPQVAGGEAAAAIRKAGIISLGAYFVLVAVIVALVMAPERFTRMVRAACGIFSYGLAEKAGAMAGKFAHGLSVVKDPRLLLLILFYSALHWAPLFVPIWLLFKAFGYGYGVYVSIFFLVATCFSVALPSTPGFVGTFEAAGAGAMMLLGMGKEQALGFTLLAHMVNFIPVTLIGFIYLWKENLSLGGLKEAEAEVTR